MLINNMHTMIINNIYINTYWSQRMACLLHPSLKWIGFYSKYLVMMRIIFIVRGGDVNRYDTYSLENKYTQHSVNSVTLPNGNIKRSISVSVSITLSNTWLTYDVFGLVWKKCLERNTFVAVPFYSAKGWKWAALFFETVMIQYSSFAF